MLKFTKRILLSLFIFFASMNNIEAIELGKNYESPCIEFIEPLPYNPDSMYMSYFNYQIAVASGIGIPGVDYPPMYIYAHKKGNFQQYLIDPKVVDFSQGEDDGTVLLSQNISFNLKYLEPFHPLCDTITTDTITGYYTVTAITTINGFPELYHTVYPELFPSNIFDESILNLDIFHYFYCDFPSPLSSPSKRESKNQVNLKMDNSSFLNGSISTYPNPFIDEIIIETQNTILYPNASIKIISTTGELKSSNYLKNSKTHLSLSFLKPGTYFIVVSNGNRQEVQKIVKLM